LHLLCGAIESSAAIVLGGKDQSLGPGQ
jgi:hypothetical protein